MTSRGRPSDLANVKLREYAESQIRCLEADYIAPEWVIDPTDLSVERLCEVVIGRLALDV